MGEREGEILRCGTREGGWGVLSMCVGGGGGGGGGAGGGWGGWGV